MNNMNKQAFFNMVVSVSGFLCIWTLTVFWQSVNDVKVRNEDLNNQLSEVKVLVAGDYVKKADVKDFMIDITNKLQRIEDKLDKKVDKK